MSMGSGGWDWFVGTQSQQLPVKVMIFLEKGIFIPASA
jgi:hypothetical protein